MMNILYLHTAAECEEDVIDAWKAEGCSLVEWKCPEEEENNQEYAQVLIGVIQEHTPDVVFSLGYSPIVSIVCEAIKIKYVSWVVSSYEPSIYSCTLLNECNYIFMSDYAVYEEFVENGFENVFYLPLAAQQIYVKAGKNKEGKEYKNDLLFLQKIISREKLGYTPLSPESSLKDATKGYLEGCIACQHQISGLPSMAEQLPGYVWEDLEEQFPPQIDGGSVETAAHYYDYRFFNPLITSADREIHYHALEKNEYFQVAVHMEDATKEESVNQILQSKVNLVITHRNRKSGIPQVAWNIMAVGGFLLSNYQSEYLTLFSDEKVCPVLYENEMDMLSKAIYYLNHEMEREALAANILQKVHQGHTYDKRIKKILDIVNN